VRVCNLLGCYDGVDASFEQPIRKKGQYRLEVLSVNGLARCDFSVPREGGMLPDCDDRIWLEWNGRARVDGFWQMLKPLVPKLVGSAAGPEVELRRSSMAMDWIIRTFAPAWMELANLHEEASVLRGLSEVGNKKTLEAALAPLSAARKRSAAAWDAAWAAARAAALDAARDAALDAAGAAARDAARAASRDAARAASRDAAWDAARAAALADARAAAWDAAGAAAWAAARAAALDAAGAADRDAALDAANQALAPTIRRLQRSALELVERMLEVRA
jgi:hypothetical protein